MIEALVLLMRAGLGLNWNCAGPLLPFIMQEYGVSRGEVSWIISLVSIFMTASAVPSGLLAARIGIKKTFAIGGFLIATTALVPLAPNFLSLLLLRGLFGIGAAMTVPLAGAITAQWFNPYELPLVNGFNQGSTSLGNALSLLFTVPLATALIWKAPMAIYGTIVLILALLWTFLGKDRKWAANPSKAKGNSGEGRTSPITISRALRLRTTFLLGFSVMGAFCLFSTLNSWLPTYYHEVFKMPLAKASSITSVLIISGIPASIVGGILPMRLGVRRPLLIISGLFMGISALGCFMVNNTGVIFLSGALFGVFGVVYMPSFLTIPMELPGMRPQTGVLVLALALACGNFGGFMGPLIVGYLTDITGSYIPGFLICCVLSLSLLISGILLPETGPGAKR